MYACSCVPGFKKNPFICMYIGALFCVCSGDGETSKAFESHFEQQINLYDEQVLVSLINRTGREKVS